MTDFVVTEPACRKFNAFSSFRIDFFAPRQVVAGGEKGKQGRGNIARAAVSDHNRFAALTRGIEVMVQEGVVCEQGKQRIALFVETFLTLRCELYAYVASFGSFTRGSMARCNHLRCWMSIPVLCVLVIQQSPRWYLSHPTVEWCTHCHAWP